VGKGDGGSERVKVGRWAVFPGVGGWCWVLLSANSNFTTILPNLFSFSHLGVDFFAARFCFQHFRPRFPNPLTYTEINDPN